MKYKLIVSTIILSVIVVSTGCISEKLPENVANTQESMTTKYIDGSPIITKNDFSDFELRDRIYFISRDNLSLTLQIEGSHGAGIIDYRDEIPEGYRIYGVSEAHTSKNTSKNGKFDRYLLLQYKVFDNDENLNDSLNLTTLDYSKKGFKHRLLDNASYNERRIFIFESNITNRTDANVTVILFGYDTLLGKIGVQDYKDKSLGEALKILDLVFDRLKIDTKEVKRVKLDTLTNTGTIPHNRTYNSK